MTAADLPALLQIQAACYPAGYLESEGTIHGRLVAAGETAWVAETAAGVCAYLVACPSRLQYVTALDGIFATAAAPDTLYLHDLAVAPAATGRRLGPRLVERALAYAGERQLRYASLVSVQGSARFWQRLGFAEVELRAATAHAALASYGNGAVYMSRAL